MIVDEPGVGAHDGPLRSIGDAIRREELRGKTLEGLRYGAASKLFLSGLQVVTSVSIARYLSASDYGIVAYAMVYFNFLTLFSDFGMSSAAVQRETLDKTTLPTALTLKGALAVALCCVGLATGGILIVLDQREAGALLCLLSATFVISAFGFLPQIALTRRLAYQSLAYVTIASALASTVVTVLLLVAGFRYWGVAVGNLAAAFASVAVLNWHQPMPLRLSYDHQTAVALYRFGGAMFLTGLVNFVVLNADNALIGSINGPEALGQYALAFTFSFVVIGQVGGLLVSVLFPIYSRMQRDPEGLRRLYLRSLSYAAVVVVLVNGGLFCVASQFLFVVMGGGTEKWLPAMSAFKILCFDGLLAGLLLPIAPLTIAIGRPDLQLRAVLAAAVVELALIVPALKLGGIEGVALTVTVACMAQYAVYAPALKRAFRIGGWDLARAVGPSVAGGVAMLVASIGVSRLERLGRGWMILLAETACLAACFAGVHTAITRGHVVREVWSALMETYSAKARRE